MDKTFYVLLGFQRVGSGGFENLLGNQCDVCHDMTRLPNIQEDERDAFIRNFPDHFENNFESAYGFKCWRDYYPDEKICENIIENSSFKKIFMYRDNVFKAVLSRLIYEKTGKFNIFEGEEYDLCDPFEIKESELLWRINEIKESYNMWLSCAKECNADFIEINYEDLYLTNKDDVLNKVFKFLNVDADGAALYFDTEKLNTNDILSKLIINLEDICTSIAEKKIDVFMKSKD